jgi:hypothetical protein
MRVRKYSGRQQIVLPRCISFNEFQEKHGLSILQAALARARRWQTMLDSGRFTTVRQLALSEKVDPSYVSRVMNLNLLCPEIVEYRSNLTLGCHSNLTPPWSQCFSH